MNTIYQTLSDEGNYDYVRENGPFPCTRDDAWLGDGYYFWDTDIDLAHWWGSVGYQYKYIICEAKCNYENARCLDLVGNMRQLKTTRELVKELKKMRLITHKTTFRRVLKYLDDKFNFLDDFDAIRVNGIKSYSYNEKTKKITTRFQFSFKTVAFIDLSPAVQICLFDKNVLEFSDYKIVYPKEIERGNVVPMFF